MKLTKNFTLEELSNSSTAKRLGIDNIPNNEQVNNLRLLCEKVLQPIREKYGKPIIVSSGFRCDKLNKAVGGSKTSEHRYGMAADFHSLSDTLSDNKELWDLIRTMNLNFGQLIYEYGSDYGPDWIHISYNEKNNRKQILRCKKANGKALYSTMK